MMVKLRLDFITDRNIYFEEQLREKPQITSHFFREQGFFFSRVSVSNKHAAKILK